jgi:hypothetical protein
VITQYRKTGRFARKYGAKRRDLAEGADVELDRLWELADGATKCAIVSERLSSQRNPRATRKQIDAVGHKVSKAIWTDLTNEVREDPTVDDRRGWTLTRLEKGGLAFFDYMQLVGVTELTPEFANKVARVVARDLQGFRAKMKARGRLMKTLRKKLGVKLPKTRANPRSPVARVRVLDRLAGDTIVHEAKGCKHTFAELNKRWGRLRKEWASPGVPRYIVQGLNSKGEVVMDTSGARGTVRKHVVRKVGRKAPARRKAANPGPRGRTMAEARRAGNYYRLRTDPTDWRTEYDFPGARTPAQAARYAVMRGVEPGTVLHVFRVLAGDRIGTSMVEAAGTVVAPVVKRARGTRR